jgi:hypothetical protein
MTRTFTGILAVLHHTTTDGRQLDEPHPELTRPAPLPLLRPGDYTTAGTITRVWRDGDLIRYSGLLRDDHPEAEKITADIAAGRLVGMLDADGAQMEFWRQGRLVPEAELDSMPLDADLADMVTVVRGWRVAAASLLPSDGKAWPEVSLTLDSEEKTG